MNYGRFFLLDPDASDVSNGITVFNYRGLRDEKKDGRCEHPADTPRYPVYVSIHTKGVFFYVHYAVYDQQDRSTVIHQNSLILSLPVSSNFDIKDNLSEHIDGIHERIFSSQLEGAYLTELIENHYQRRPNRLSSEDITYSSLEIFDFPEDRPSSRSYSSIGRIVRSLFSGSSLQKASPVAIFLRHLFLDFLYDLEHTDVFENANLYEEIYIKLHENFLFNAIANKAEYYYRRQQQLDIPMADYPTVYVDKKLFYVDYYSKAEQKWVETITHPQAERCFYESPWFSKAEIEMNRIYLPEHHKPADEKIKRIKKSSCSTTQPCIDYFNHITVSERQAGLPNPDKKFQSQKKIEERLKASARTASHWYMKKYSFSGTVKIWYGENYKWIGALIVFLLFGLCMTLITPSFDEDLIKNQIFPPLGILLIILLIWGLGFVDRKKWNLRTIGCLNMMMPRLFSAIIAAWFTLAIGEDVFKGFFDTTHQWKISIGLLVILVIFVYYEIGKINPYLLPIRRLLRSGALMLVAFSQAFLIGLLVTHFFGAKYLERSDYIDEFYINRVYTATPDFGVELQNKPRLVHQIFYETLAKSNDTLVPFIASHPVDPFIKDRMNGSYRQKDPGYYPCLSFKSPQSERTEKIDYQLTLLLVRQFIREDSLPLNRMLEKMIEGSTIKSRVNQVADFYQHLLRHDPLYIDKLAPIDSVFYHTAWLNLLKSVDNHEVYRKTLKELKPLNNNRTSILIETEAGVWIFRDMLLQFTFFALFIGIFIQLIFEEKSITEPL